MESDRAKSKSPVRRIAIIRPSALGDVCRTVPVAVSLKRANPEARIEWIVQDTFVDAVKAHPGVSEVIPFPRRKFARAGRSLTVGLDLWGWISDLRRRRYDVVYDLQGLARSAMIAWGTRAPRRVGFADAREGGFLGYTHRHRVPGKAHAVDRMIGLLAADGIEPAIDLQLYTPAEDQAWRRDCLSELGIQPGARGAVLAPTSRWVAKRWPDDRFAALIDPLLERGFGHILVVGAASERDQCRAVRARCDGTRVVDLVGATTVGGLMAVVQGADLVVANDSAVLHMAVGFGTRYLALYGPTDTKQVGPYGGDQWVIQHVAADEDLHHKDKSLGDSVMKRISVKEVLGRLDRLLSQRPLGMSQ